MGGRLLLCSKTMPPARHWGRMSRSKAPKYVRAASPSSPRRVSRSSSRRSCLRVWPRDSMAADRAGRGALRACRMSMVLQLATLPIRKERARSAVCRGLSVARYWARRKSTFPLVGPWTDAMKRPLSENQETVTPSAAQCSRRYGLQLTRPKQAMDWSVCRGMVPRRCPSWCSSTHSPCLESQVSCVVTNKVFR